ncbi:hypothetical protein Tco_1302648 [Tanacetum coccineum]
MKDHNDSLIAQMNKKSIENVDLKARIQEKVFAIAVLKNELRKLKGNSMNTKFAKPSVLGKLVLQPLRNQSVVRQPTAFKSERPKISKPRFASQGTSINVQKRQSIDLSAVVLKSSAVTSADASDKRQQQPYSTSSTSTLATAVTADGNFDLSYALSWKSCQGGSSKLNLSDHRYKCRCYSPIPAKSDSLPRTHTQAIKVNH